MISIRRRFVGLLSAAGLGLFALACSGAGGDSGGVGQSIDPLLGGDGGFPASPCASCIQTSCSSELAALEAELKTLHSATEAAFQCVQQNGCLQLFWSGNHDDAGAGGKSAVEACIAACDTTAGIDRDAAASALSSLSQALESCVSASCASSCPFADHDAGVHLGGPSSHDGGFGEGDGGFGLGNGTGNGSGSGSGGGFGGGGGSGFGFGDGGFSFGDGGFGFGNGGDGGFDSDGGHHHY